MRINALFGCIQLMQSLNLNQFNLKIKNYLEVTAPLYEKEPSSSENRIYYSTFLNNLWNGFSPLNAWKILSIIELNLIQTEQTFWLRRWLRQIKQYKQNRLIEHINPSFSFVTEFLPLSVKIIINWKLYRCWTHTNEQDVVWSLYQNIIT